MDKDASIKQRQVANVAVLEWGSERKVVGTILFFGTEYLFQPDDKQQPIDRVCIFFYIYNRTDQPGPLSVSTTTSSSRRCRGSTSASCWCCPRCLG